MPAFEAADEFSYHMQDHAENEEEEDRRNAEGQTSRKPKATESQRVLEDRASSYDVHMLGRSFG